MRDDFPENGILIDGTEPFNPTTREFYNSRTRKHVNNQRVVYFFDYLREKSYAEEVITWRELKYLKDHDEWNIIRHPMVLNYINEKLLDKASSYVAHILAYFAFLLLLSSYIFDKNALQDALATIALMVFIFCLFVKGAIKLQAGCASMWFFASYLFNIITYTATLLYIWTPQLFSYDDYNHDLKHFITWFLPIVAIISAWINFLYILRKSPCGIYILMMSRIFYTFSTIAIIWIPTLLAFSFAFHLVMRNSGTEPWEATEIFTKNATVTRKFLAILQAITKTSAMMIGEVDADNVLGQKEWIPNILLLAFEVTTVILLMNLMISLAVGDVNELRHSAQGKLLEIKVNFTIEALQLSESCSFIRHWDLLYRQPTKNVLVVEDDGTSFTLMENVELEAKENEGKHADNGEKMAGKVAKPPFNYSVNQPINSDIELSRLSGTINSFTRSVGCQINDPAETQKVYFLKFPSSDRRLRLHKQNLVGGAVQILFDAMVLQLIESTESGIENFNGTINGVKTIDMGTNPESMKRRFARWLIGLEWKNLFEL